MVKRDEAVAILKLLEVIGELRLLAARAETTPEEYAEMRRLYREDVVPLLRLLRELARSG